jgi:tRNA threonylcarbamoyladenosine biosynthesis protein TsaB
VAVRIANTSVKILALETSTDFCSVCLLVGEDIHCTGENAGQRHSELLLPMVDELLRCVDLKVSDLDAIAFGAGPGSFTGLRIACGVAQGLAYSVDGRCIPVGSLEALAQASGASRVVACTDARLGQVYRAAFERDGAGWREVMPPSLCYPDDPAELPEGNWLGCGSGFDRYPQIVDGPYRGKLEQVRRGMLPHAREIALLGAQYLAAGRSVPSAEAAPIYVRNKVALTIKEQG